MNYCRPEVGVVQFGMGTIHFSTNSLQEGLPTRTYIKWSNSLPSVQRHRALYMAWCI